MNQHRLHVASAVQMNGRGSNPRWLSSVLTSFKMGQILPIFHRECVPGDKFDVSISSFSRFLPMSAPAYVDLTYRTMSVFVPYHQVMEGAESFFANQDFCRGVLNVLPHVSAEDICMAFIQHNDLTTLKQKSTVAEKLWPKNYFSDSPSTATNIYMLTAKGAYCDKLLHMLGLRFPRQAQIEDRYNALPLLAFAHAYNCYLSYSAHYNDSSLSSVLEDIKRHPRDLTSLDVYTILTSILLTYEESFFSTVWSSAFSSQFDGGRYGQSDLDGDTIIQNSQSTDYDENTGGYGRVNEDDHSLSAQQVRLLLKFDDYFRRTQYAGSKDIEQIYSRFGVRIDDYKTRYPYFLSESARQVSIGDVTSTADSNEESPLGEYAGKAIMSDDAGFHLDCHDYGMVFTFAWFAPRPIYAEGIDKEWLRQLPFDFYTPELDQGFAAPVDYRQIYAGDKSIDIVNGLFGFTRYYSEYLWPQDIVAGDFERYEEYAAWHFGRNCRNLQSAQIDSLIYIPQQGTEFERIFNVASVNEYDADSVRFIAKVRVNAHRPMRDLTSKAGLGEGDLDLPQNGSQMN